MKMTLVIHANKFDSAIVEVVGESEKALQVKNTESGRVCWLPKSGIKAYKPGVPTYENEYEVSGWFRSKLNLQQERVLNLAE